MCLSHIAVLPSSGQYRDCVWGEGGVIWRGGGPFLSWCGPNGHLIGPHEDADYLFYVLSMENPHKDMKLNVCFQQKACRLWLRSHIDTKKSLCPGLTGSLMGKDFRRSSPSMAKLPLLDS